MLPHNPASPALLQARWLLVRRPGGMWERREVTGARLHKRFVLLRLAGVDRVEEAEALIGARVALPRGDLPPPEPGQVYWIDLVGAQVRTEDGRPVGRVADIMRTGSNDVLVVRDGGREHLIPLIADVVVRLDAEQGEIVIRPLPGLLEP